MIAHIALALSLVVTAPAAQADLSLPGANVKYHEQSGDPVRLTAYGLGTTGAYLRTGDRFARQRGLSEAALSPDGRTVAGVPRAYRSGHDALLLTDRATGTTRRIRTVKKPLTASYVSWTRDSRRVALTVERKTGGRWRAAGFTVVDVKAGTARTVTVAGMGAAAGFWWTPGGNLIATYGTGLRVYSAADGKVLRTLTGVGPPTGPEDSFSPSGRRMALWCPARFAGQICLADTATGRIAGRIAVEPEALFGWWDESHVIAVMAHRGAYRLAVVGLDGKVGRVLAAVPYRTWAAGLWLSFTRAAARQR
ncbi:hypothetical protein [Nonomuraea sp. SBT364]|uniref:hypothetical protein n=1 Tax=Nonomuraea sp. SBT364 TaxID=1580530 RepID=UPI000A6C1EBE|nr:hypothetical protein [Nonomuraea sp. SBT364]